MTIQSVEQALDSAIALLMYGSGAWLSYSLLSFILTRPKQSVETPTVSKSVVSKSVVSKSVVSKSVVSKQTTISAAPVPLLPPTVVPTPETLPIVCKPVNWKKWKVSELRQASIAKACGVRTTPIGSKRKLKKADLIAQYEQNLKRMTYEQGSDKSNVRALQSEKIA